MFFLCVFGGDGAEERERRCRFSGSVTAVSVVVIGCREDYETTKVD